MQNGSKYIVIGAGLTGLSAAYHLGNNYTVIEKENTVGGLCRTVQKNGFFFDYSGHLLHLSNEYTKKLVVSLLPHTFDKHFRRAHIYYRKHEVPFPFQANLSALPNDIKKECLLEFINAYCRKKVHNPKTFEDWVHQYFGTGLAKHFFIPYNTKLFGESLNNLTPEWCEQYVPKPNLEETIDGVLGNQTQDFGYNASFLYPKEGGIQVLADSLAERVENIKLGLSVRTVRWKQKELVTDNDETLTYESLVSTIPLPELAGMLNPIPHDIEDSRDQLKWRTVHCFNVGIRKAGSSKSHWAYYPESDFVFYRVGFIHNICEKSVPKGHSAYYIEIACDPKEDVDIDNLRERSIKDLKKAGMLDENDEVVVMHHLSLPFAYVVYDHARTAAVMKIKYFLEQHGIYSVGRYGEWKYSAMETAILDGKDIAERLSS